MTIGTFTNAGSTAGGNGGGVHSTVDATGGSGGIGVSNAGTITTLTNASLIVGGGGGDGGYFLGDGGAGATAFVNSGAIRMLTNKGTIDGGGGGAATLLPPDQAPRACRTRGQSQP